MSSTASTLTPSTLTPSTTRQASSAYGERHVSQRLSADKAMDLIAALKDGRARVQLRAPCRPARSSSASSSSSTMVATAPQEPASPSPAGTASPSTHKPPSYTLIDLAVANDPVLRAKLEALPAAYHPPLGGRARPVKSVEPSAPKACGQEGLTYEEVMRIVGPVVRSESGPKIGAKGEGRKKGKRRGLFAWMRGRL
ncbi:hypothetical protein MMC11_002230 [Xylographa trunciseda]|nr:hypothetical protein [Xylographa trunciseda]